MDTKTTASARTWRLFALAFATHVVGCALIALQPLIALSSNFGASLATALGSFLLSLVGAFLLVQILRHGRAAKSE